MNSIKLSSFYFFDLEEMRDSLLCRQKAPHLNLGWGGLKRREKKGETNKIK